MAACRPIDTHTPSDQKMATGVRTGLNVHSLFLGPIGAEVAWLVALRSLPCHMGTSYLARLTGY